jgi:hypothetical protein
MRRDFGRDDNARSTLNIAIDLDKFSKIIVVSGFVGDVLVDMIEDKITVEQMSKDIESIFI